MGATGGGDLTGLYLGAAGSGFSAYSAYSAGQSNRRIGKANAQLADIAAQDAIQRGNMEADKSLARTRQQVGDQRAALAAQGVLVDSGTGADITNQTESLGALDAMTIKNNAAREAFGFRQQADNARIGGKFAALRGQNEAYSTLLTGGARAADRYNEYKQARGR